MSPEYSALLASLAIAVVGFARGYRGTRLGLRSFGQVFVDTGVSMVDLILVVAAAGFMIGVLNVTGLGFALTLVLVDAVNGNPTILLLVSAVICIILGMGMPTSGVYVLLASLVAPSLVKAGVDPIAANMFILYFGMMSMITPPVALASFAAATISRAGALTTALHSMKMGWAAFLLPFAFVETPALLMHGPLSGTIFAFAITAFGIAGVTIGITGYWERKLGLPLQAAFVVLGVLALPLGFLGLSSMLHAFAAAGVALVAGALLVRKPKPTQDRQAT